jgi:hypothetical protein
MINQQSFVALLDSSDRWRLFAVAACVSAVKSQQQVDLYAARLRARRAFHHVYAHGRGVWLRVMHIEEDT